MTPERWMAWLARIAAFLCKPFVRFDISGGEQINRELGAVIIAVDHRSLFDVIAGVIVFHQYHRYPRVLVEQKYVDSRLVGPFARGIGAIPVDRVNHRSRAVDSAVAMLAGGATVLLLPEGRLHWDPADPISTGPAATGVSRMAAASGVPVVAAGMVGTETVWPAGRRFPTLRIGRRRVVTVRVADRVVDLPPGDDHRARTDAVMAEVRRLMAEAAAAAGSGRQADDSAR